MGRRQPKTRKEQEQPVVRLPLPSDVVGVADNGSRCENIGLWLDRFLTVDGKWELTQDAKQRIRVFQLMKTQRAQGIVNALKQRHEALLQWYRRQGFEVRQFEAKPVWRFVVGLGAAHVLETAITLHRIFGLPIIPASGLKGAARAYALCELANKLGVPILSPSEAEELKAKEEKTPLQKLEELIAFFAKETDKQKRQAKLDDFLKIALLPPNAPIRELDSETFWQTVHPFVDVFGTTDQAGKIVFLDAIPLDMPNFELDIMNPHFPEYYRKRGQEPPSDWQSPNPVTFLTVSKTSYRFAVAARTKDASSSLDTAEKWLKSALEKIGIGAKTSADYGYWEPKQ